MIKIMFVCHGNICRSPMAEFIFKDLICKKGLENQFFIASSATSTEEIGNPVYPPARRILASHGIACDGKYATQLKAADYEKFDLFLCMDQNNLRNIARIFKSDPQNKVKLLMSYAGESSDVADPWYSGNFEIAYRDIEKGCTALLKEMIR